MLTSSVLETQGACYHYFTYPLRHYYIIAFSNMYWVSELCCTFEGYHMANLILLMIHLWLRPSQVTFRQDLIQWLFQCMYALSILTEYSLSLHFQSAKMFSYEEGIEGISVQQWKFSFVSGLAEILIPRHISSLLPWHSFWPWRQICTPFCHFKTLAFASYPAPITGYTGFL